MSTAAAVTDFSSLSQAELVAQLAAFQQQNASLTTLSSTLEQEIAALRHRIAWFEKQLFGPKSEKRLLHNPQQLQLGADPAAPAGLLPTPQDQSTPVAAHQRRSKVRDGSEVNDCGLRFGPDVPVTVIEILPAELTGPEADQYEVISERVTHRLAQRSAVHEVLEYRQKVIKHKGSGQMLCPKAPANVLEGCTADVSLLAGLLVDKFQYHLPLYRQHQRMAQSGIKLSRSSLTNWVKAAVFLLKPIASAQLDSVLESRLLAIDETGIKVGKGKTGRGKAGKTGNMKQGWFWPLYGDKDEIVFTYADTRGQQHLRALLHERFTGTLLSDGYAAYTAYASKTEGLTHAQCWVHARRHLLEARAWAPQAVDEALVQIGQLYDIEEYLRNKGLNIPDKREAKRQYRLEHSKPVVDAFMRWCRQQQEHSLLTANLDWKRALGYVLTREDQLRVFLEDPDVQLDTNHLERAIRPIALGRRNWLFCWTELGAEYVGIVQSLISTCKLHGINPVTYLTDVLLRVDQHPQSQIRDLTPRLWKDKFAGNPLRSDLYRACASHIGGEG